MPDPFITTFTGRKVNPLDLKPEDICIDDIAHHSALINRFVGATHRPITLAQHVVYVSRLVEDDGWGMEGLFHDAAEAYLGDVSKWVKQMGAMAAYREAEDRALAVICTALGLRDCEPDRVPVLKDADRLMVRYESMREISQPGYLAKVPGYHLPVPDELARVGAWQPWGWRAAEQAFWDQYRRLGGTVQPVPRNRAGRVKRAFVAQL